MSALPVRFDEDGLIPAVVQDADSGAVLMMAYMDAESLALTRESGQTHFWSRSRGKLWHKGESSGHVQIVESIAVNCYDNCLLIRVRQVGACCHTGYQTCFYRQLTPDGDLVPTEEPAFDPEEVYGSASLASLVAEWAGAYRWLADHGLESQSETSRLLRTASLSHLASRVADELNELAGVVRGEHAHSSLAEDIALEGSQALYWIALAAIRAGLSDRELTEEMLAGGRWALSNAPADPSGALVASASRWSTGDYRLEAGRIRKAVGLVENAGALAGLRLADIISRDLTELRSRAYLRSYFASVENADSPDS